MLDLIETNSTVNHLSCTALTSINAVVIGQNGL
jgi:hypothetical protein